jgi:hypothetical protein
VGRVKTELERVFQIYFTKQELKEAKLIVKLWLARLKLDMVAKIQISQEEKYEMFQLRRVWNVFIIKV